MHLKAAAQIYLVFIAMVAISILSSSCSGTKHIPEGQYLLKRNNIEFKSKEPVARKKPIKGGLERLVAQKPNTDFLGIPYKLLLYNLQYEKYQNDPDNFQLESKTVEKPVIYDSSLHYKSIDFMETFMLHQGYFYARISDTTKFKNKKAYVTYTIKPGINYKIKNVGFQIQDSNIYHIIQEDFKHRTFLKEGEEYSDELVEQERNRIVEMLRDKGFYYFNNDNMQFVRDTLQKRDLRGAESPFESAIRSINDRQKEKTIDVIMVINNADDPKTFKRYGINRVLIFPDYQDRADFRSEDMEEYKYNGVRFKYHNYYVKEGVIANHTYLTTNKYYSITDHDKTISELNQLGVFESVRVDFREDTSRGGGDWLNCVIRLSPGKKYDYNTSIEASSGNSYTAGTSLSLTLRDKNFAKGANILTASLSGGLESLYVDSIGNSFLEHFILLSKTASFNMSLDLPKFLFPISTKRYSIRNSPRTVFSAGISLFDRVNYFTLVNTSSSFKYKWNETETKSWEVTPAFVNLLRLPYIDNSFQERLDSNDFLKNTYRETFIEGENVTWLFTNRYKIGRLNDDYSYIKLSLEEAGLLISGIKGIARIDQLEYAKYVKFDFDLQQFFIKPKSTYAFRFYGGFGIPYTDSGTTSLPYIKQYFVGGAYSLRGWRVRTLGPGSDTSQKNNQGFIDRTGDIKLELNGEYRFEVLDLFGGAMKLNGAAFADAGNIWLANRSITYPKGTFELRYLASDLAIDAGIGARLNIADFILVRFDVAMPIKQPSRVNDPWWELDEIDFGNSTWRSNNIVFNFAIGYPF